MLSRDKVCGAHCAEVSFVVVAIVRASVGIRGTEVQFVRPAWHYGAAAAASAAREKAILKESDARCESARTFAPSHGDMCATY